MKAIPENATLGELYGPAMEITDQAEADEYFEAIVHHLMTRFGEDRVRAELAARGGLGYYCGYFDSATMIRVQRLFRCVHPVFGGTGTGITYSSAKSKSK